MFTANSTKNDLEKFFNSTGEYRKFIVYVYCQLTRCNGQKVNGSVAVANELLNQYRAGNVAEIIATAYELGFAG